MKRDRVLTCIVWGLMILFGIIECTGVVLIALKLCRAIDWSWLVVIIPVWICGAATVIALVVGLLIVVIDKLKRK